MVSRGTVRCSCAARILNNALQFSSAGVGINELRYAATQTKLPRREYSQQLFNHCKLATGEEPLTVDITTYFHLVVDSTRSLQQFPMGGARGHVKRSGKAQQNGARRAHRHAELGKANIVANPHANFSVGCIHGSDPVPRAQGIGLSIGGGGTKSGDEHQVGKAFVRFSPVPHDAGFSCRGRKEKKDCGEGLPQRTTR